MLLMQTFIQTAGRVLQFSCKTRSSSLRKLILFAVVYTKVHGLDNAYVDGVVLFP